MSTLTTPAPVATSTTDDLDHLYCCYPDVALCGRDISGVPFSDSLPNLCVVCVDLAAGECDECGAEGRSS